MAIFSVSLWLVLVSGIAAAQTHLSSVPPGCMTIHKPGIELRCERFRDTVFAVATANLQDAGVMFYWDRSAPGESGFDGVGRAAENMGIVPVIATNGGIYENSPGRPLGLLIDGGMVLRSANLAPGSGNFFWNSTVVRISSEHWAYMLPVKNWNQALEATSIAALQSGPKLITGGVIEPSISPESHSRYTRTALCLPGQGSAQITLVVSLQEVTLFQLSTFLAEQLHCGEALHLDGAVSSMYDFTRKMPVLSGPAQNELVTFILFGVPKPSKPN